MIHNSSYITNKLKNLINESVQRMTMGKVHYGVFLSGGLDSSIITSFLSRNQEEPLKTFSIGYSHDIFQNESDHAKRLALDMGADHHEILFEAKDMEKFPTIVWHQDEPISDASSILTYSLSKKAKRYVKFVLVGEGADEIFAGYKRYHDLGDTGRNFNTQDILNHINVYDYKERNKIFMDKMHPHIKKNCFRQYNHYFSPKKCPIKAFQSLDLVSWLPNDVLLKNDKQTMANSIEARVPFLDTSLYQFARKIPTSLLINKQNEKIILKKAVKGIVPDYILKRKKQGFHIPTQYLIENGFKESAENVLENSLLIRDKYINKDFIDKVHKRIPKENKNSLNSSLNQFWNFFYLENWYNLFIERNIFNMNGGLTLGELY
ncbi:MAG: asparagine synthase C-terminal domain-containing protein [Candidatus Woesearchaeota archaeon]